MQIYDRVINRQLGPMIIGSVVAIIDSGSRHKFGIGDVKRWDELYSDWQDKLIFMVKLDRAEKCITKEENSENYEDEVMCNYLFFPEEDLVLLDDL